MIEPYKKHTREFPPLTKTLTNKEAKKAKVYFEFSLIKVITKMSSTLYELLYKHYISGVNFGVCK
jgi:hypothetical protein